MAGCLPYWRKRVRKAVRAGLAAAALLSAQPLPSGPQVVTLLSSVDDTDQPYALYVPRRFDPAEKYPLVISLHEEGSNHRLNLRRVFGRGNLPREPDSEAGNRPFPPFPDVDFIVAAPLARGNMGYQGIPEKDVYDVLEDVKRKFRIDEDRIYLTGASMGGGGAFWIGLTRPDLWAAIAAVCPSPLEQADELAANALNVPVWIFQGALDPLVPVELNRQRRDRLRAAGVRVEWTEYSAVRHNAWDFAYRGGTVFSWFRGIRRERFPQRVHFSTRSYKYRSAYWVELDGITPGELAVIDARFTGTNRIEIQTSGVDGFTLRLEECANCQPESALTLSLDGAPVKVKMQERVSLSRTAQGWREGRYQLPAGAKGPGREGPIREAVSRRHIYVYGTADGPDAEEVQRRREVASRAATWVRPPERLLLSLRVAADSEISEEDMRAADLVLFGTQETNALIARLAPQLPLRLSPGAADFGLLFIAPAGGRYVLVNSGLPWWTGAEQSKRAGMPSQPLPYEVLPTFGDFLLFKRSLQDVVAEGHFDRNWKVPAGAAARLAEAGVVQIQ